MTLYGVYGRHEISDCPLNNKEIAKGVVDFANKDMGEILSKYKINKIVAQYHSGLEHTFLWVFDAQDAHLIEQFAIENGIARFNEVKIVPLLTFKEVVDAVKKIHRL